MVDSLHNVTGLVIPLLGTPIGQVGNYAHTPKDIGVKAYSFTLIRCIYNENVPFEFISQVNSWTP